MNNGGSLDLHHHPYFKTDNAPHRKPASNEPQKRRKERVAGGIASIQSEFGAGRVFLSELEGVDEFEMKSMQVLHKSCMTCYPHIQWWRF